MPSILNSDDGVVSGTSGLKSTGGNDGLLNIQSNGSTIVAVTGSGISVTGTVSQTGVSTFAAGTASAPSITFTGDTNTGIFSSGADTVNITTGGSERMRIDSSGNLMVGDTGVDCRLWVQRTTDGNAFGTRATFATYAATVGFFGADRNTTNNSFYYLNCYNYGASDYRFRVADSGSISTAGSIQLGDAGAPPTSGVGVKFPATQSASTDANTLDDYEEGTWTPAFAIAGGSVTNTTQSGYYTKVGNLVTAWGHLVTNGVSGSGSVTITGLPFTSASAGTADGVGSKSVFLRFATDMPNLTLLVDRNATTISLFKQATNATSTANVIGTDLSNTTSYNQLNFVVSYRV